MYTTARLKAKFRLIWPHLNERGRRMMAATEALQLGRGGVSAVSRACGLSRVTITKGIHELDEPALEAGRVRRPGAGRPSLVALDPDLPSTLESLVEPVTRGDPESPLRWTSKSTRVLALELKAQEHPASHETVARLLRSMGYSLQSNRKTEEGGDHPDRDAQFRHINEAVRAALDRGQPVISVDTKKKELIGNYVNSGRQWRPAKQPLRVNGHDFPGLRSCPGWRLSRLPRASPSAPSSAAMSSGAGRSSSLPTSPRNDDLGRASHSVDDASRGGGVPEDGAGRFDGLLWLGASPV